MNSVLLMNTDEYNGLYVAMKSFEDSEVVGSGESPSIALCRAAEKGFNDHVLAYIPEKETVNIY